MEEFWPTHLGRIVVIQPHWRVFEHEPPFLRSCHSISIGFRSGLWLGHSKVFISFRLETNDAMTPNPLITKEESSRVYKCDDERLSGSTKRWFSKVCEIFKVRSIESLKYVHEFHTPVCNCGNISTPETWRWTKRTMIGCLTCRSKWPHGQALANESCHLFQTFSRQSEGLATRD